MVSSSMMATGPGLFPEVQQRQANNTEKKRTWRISPVAKAPTRVAG